MLYFHSLFYHTLLFLFKNLVRLFLKCCWLLGNSLHSWQYNTFLYFLMGFLLMLRGKKKLIIKWIHLNMLILNSTEKK